MMLKYASIDRISKRLSGRLTIVNLSDYGITGITGTQVGTDVIEIVGESVENFIDMYLTMVYIMPLINTHPFINAIADKLTISEVYTTYFPSSVENTENSEGFASILRQQALNDFQCLFNGLGIFVPGASADTFSIVNDESRQQMANKAIVLLGERLKKFIGHDFDGDNVSDSDLFKLNTNVSPTFYSTGDFEDLAEGQTVLNGVRVKPRNKYEEEVNFF